MPTKTTKNLKRKRKTRFGAGGEDIVDLEDIMLTPEVNMIPRPEHSTGPLRGTGAEEDENRSQLLGLTEQYGGLDAERASILSALDRSTRNWKWDVPRGINPFTNFNSYIIRMTENVYGSPEYFEIYNARQEGRPEPGPPTPIGSQNDIGGFMHELFVDQYPEAFAGGFPRSIEGFMKIPLVPRTNLFWVSYLNFKFMVSSIKDILTFIRWFGRMPVFPALTESSIDDYLNGNNGGDLDILIFLAERKLRDPTTKTPLIFGAYNDGVNNANLLIDGAIGENDNLRSLRIRPDNILKMCREINMKNATIKKRKVGGFKLAYARKIERGSELIKWAIQLRKKTHRGFGIPRHNPGAQPEIYQQQSDIFANSILEIISELKAKIADFGMKMYVDHQIWPIRPKRISATSERPEHLRLITSFRRTNAATPVNRYHYYAHTGPNRLDFTEPPIFGVEPMITSLNISSPGYIPSEDSQYVLDTICDNCINDPISLLKGYGLVSQCFIELDIIGLKWYYDKMLNARDNENSIRAVNLGLLSPEGIREAVTEVTPLLAGSSTNPLFTERESDLAEVSDTEIWQVQFWDGLMAGPNELRALASNRITSDPFWHETWLPRVIEEQRRLGILATIGKGITDAVRQAIHIIVYTLVQAYTTARIASDRTSTWIITPIGRVMLSSGKALTKSAIRTIEAAPRNTIRAARSAVIDDRGYRGSRTATLLGNALECPQCKVTSGYHMHRRPKTFFDEGHIPKSSLTDLWKFDPTRWKGDGTKEAKLKRHWMKDHGMSSKDADFQVAAQVKLIPQKREAYLRNLAGSFGKIMKPYKPFLHKINKKGVWLKTQFGVKKLQDNTRGLFIQGPGQRKFYLYNWPRK